MLVFGAIDFAAAVARIGSFLGYRVTVCDARPVFATRQRFPDADEVVVDWPHRYLAGGGRRRADRRAHRALRAHPRPEVRRPAAGGGAAPATVAYVGAMGSRRTHEDRLAPAAGGRARPRRSWRGCPRPIGLDLGARTPEETAVSIAAEIIALRWGGAGERLAASRGAIHHGVPR